MYRWRSKVGEKYYSKIWNQVIQNFSVERQFGASTPTQLKVDRPEYMVGEKVVITCKLFTQFFAPLKEAAGAYSGSRRDERGRVGRLHFAGRYRRNLHRALSPFGNRTTGHSQGASVLDSVESKTISWNVTETKVQFSAGAQRIRVRASGLMKAIDSIEFAK